MHRAGGAGPCGGILKSATISFGQNLVARGPRRADGRARTCDLLLAVGSTLSRLPGGRAWCPAPPWPGAQVVIVNDEPTEYDAIADVVLRAPISEVLPAIVAALDGGVGPSIGHRALVGAGRRSPRRSRRDSAERLRRGFSANHQMLATVPATPSAATRGLTNLRPRLTPETLPAKRLDHELHMEPGALRCPEARRTRRIASPAEAHGLEERDGRGVLRHRLQMAPRDVHARRLSSQRYMRARPTPWPRARCSRSMWRCAGHRGSMTGDGSRRRTPSARPSPSARHTMRAVPGRSARPRRQKWRPMIPAGFHARRVSTHPSR